VARQKKTTKARAANGKGKMRPAKEPSPHELLREPDITAPATVRCRCELFIKVTHQDYMPHEVMALVRQGQVDLDPLAPGRVGTLILNGFPYTVLGYYTFLEQDAEYDQPLGECGFHGPFYDFYRNKAATFQDMVNATGDEFEKARQLTRDLNANMARVMANRQKRRAHSRARAR
jgi:hypothetical protein